MIKKLSWFIKLMFEDKYENREGCSNLGQKLYKAPYYGYQLDLFIFRTDWTFNWFNRRQNPSFSIFWGSDLGYIRK